MAFNEFETDSAKFFLTAVNVLLQCIGEPVLDNEEDIYTVEEAKIAAMVIVETKKEILSDGWDFNSDDNYSMQPDTSNHIVVPFNMLDVSDASGDIIQRDWRLYSKSNQTAIFTEAQSMNVIWDMAFNSLTHPLRNYITIAASRKFQARQVMDTSMYAYTSEDEGTARIIAKRSDGRTSKPNMYDATFGQTYMIDGML